MLTGTATARDAGKARLARLPAIDAAAGRTSETGSLDVASTLTAADRDLYRQIFTLQHDGRMTAADAAIGRLKNPELLGHVLAQRYLRRTGYVSSYPELVRWLERYAELPQAERVYRLAQAKRLKRTPAPPLPVGGWLGGAGQELRSDRTIAANGLRKDWLAALDAWRGERFAEAARRFAALAEVDDLAGEDLAAVSFWAARSHLRGRRPQLVAGFLRRAARSSDEFYGLIAQRLLDETIDFDWHAEELRESGLAALLRFPAARRAVALVATGETGLAEDEIRKLAGRVGPSEMQVMTALSERLGLPSAQMRLAQQTRLIDGRRHDGALFPVPPWQPTTGYKLDPALVHAIIRAESAFDPQAVSHRGAVGLMQVLPTTGALVAKDLRLASLGHDELLDPATNLAVGQQWLWRLSRTPTIDRNLIRLILAYNAGEKRLADWLDVELRELGGDPLLFIESVPLAETRAYVKKVMGNLWAYEARLGDDMPSLQALAENRWPAIEHLAGKARPTKAIMVAAPLPKARPIQRRAIADARTD